MTTWREAVAAKTERLRRDARFYTPDLLGQTCTHCSHKLPLALTSAGINTHPTCGPDVSVIVTRSRRPMTRTERAQLSWGGLAVALALFLLALLTIGASS